MKCSKCNHEYDDNLGFCPLCGYVKETVIVSAPPAAQENRGKGDNTQQNEQQNPNFQSQEAPPPPNHNHGHSHDGHGNNHGAPPTQVVQTEDIRSARNNATASLVCGILALVIPFIGVILAIIALVLGNSARKRLPENETSVAAAGFILGIVSLVFSIIVIIAVLSLIGMAFFTASSIGSYLDPYYWNWRY